jgi:SAM-dependent methyltransferase
MTTRIKSLLRPLIPARLHEPWQRYKFRAEQRLAKGVPLEQTFTEIYESGVWARENGVRYHSGPGSLPDVTRAYEDFVAGYLEREPAIATLVDIGCGDFQVSNRILQRLSRPIRYHGCDIAANVVAYNQRQFGQAGKISFHHANVATDPLPEGDIVTIREVFQHLSNDTILAALANLRLSFTRAIVTESITARPAAPNLDIVSGYRTRDGFKSGVYLHLAPFSLRVLEQMDWPVTNDAILRTVLVEL